MTEAGGQTASSQPSDRLVAARSARAIADMSAANCREIWKMVDQSEESLNLLFETLADWEDILKDASEVYPQDDSEPRFKPPEVRL